MLTAAPPTGTITFLFTDMEGSTRLWDEFPDVMSAVIARHDELLGHTAADHGGYVFSRAGDGWGVAFGSSSEAVEAALDIQRRITDEPWPEPIDRIRLRMGLHAGTANERDGDFFGTAVNRAARVSAAAQGGQVFITDAVRALIVDQRAGAWQLRDLGEHRLRDLSRPERLWQIDIEGSDAPSAEVVARSLVGNLPKQGAAILGRDDDIAAISSRLSEAPVVTLVGVGGVGKTTLAIEVARGLGNHATGGTWFVDLTTVDDPREVPSWILATLGSPTRREMSDLESLVDTLATDEHILVVDNAEHLIDAVAGVVDEIARRVPRARILVTSREPLSIDAEVVHRVRPLTTTAGADRSPAASLFIERALIAAPDLTSAEIPLDVVTSICERLDGLPLAIELAAAHAETMTPSEILHALESDRLAMRSESRSVTQRHRSLEDLVAWSYERLDPTAQRVFERLSVFVGGCTADAAESVCGDDTIGASDVREALRTLVRKSMVTTDRSAGTTRFTTLETLRTYAQHRCSERPEAADVEERHARWYAEFSERLRSGLASPAAPRWLSAASVEFDNLERAARWACDHDAFDVLGTVGASLPNLFETRVPPGADAWIDLALASLPPDHLARLDYGYAAAYLTLFRGDLRGWRSAYENAVTDVPSTHRGRLIPQVFRLISAFFVGDMEMVIRDSPEVIAAAHALEDQRTAGALTGDLGLALLFTGERDRAWEIAEELQARMEESGVPTGLAWSLYLMGELASGSDPVAAMEYLEESVEYALSVDNQFVAGISLIALASTAGRHGDHRSAIDAMYRCVRVYQGTGNRPQFWTAIRNLVEILHRLGHDRDAFTLHLATEAAADQAPELFGPYGDLYRETVAEVREALPEAERSAAAHRARRLGYHETTAYAFELLKDDLLA
ncbi:MAG TPA: adenylate/guanylate cyclase domain-containing protein [Acidimicrobiia bacterium]|nr:adenylate/guanylate cyclase domain-containing protein [Acidimicrobiia bacterium]